MVARETARLEQQDRASMTHCLHASHGSDCSGAKIDVVMCAPDCQQLQVRNYERVSVCER